jgi:hypothetical protein
VAAPSYVYTIRRAAQILDEPEELVRELAMEMQPEDGRLTVLGVGDVETTAFTRAGVEYLRELLSEYRKQPPNPASRRG